MTSRPLWKEKMLKARALQGSAIETLFERAVLLVAIFDDRVFRADNGDLDDLAAAAKLDAELSDVAIDFLMLRRVLEYFPEKASWKAGNIRKMIAEVRESDREQAKSPVKPVVKRATLKEVDQLQKLRAIAERRAETTESTLASVQEENRRLREELAKAHGRIEELERVLDRQLQAV